jgi:flagellar biosynthesis/type III secretory pathway protein FliH
MRLPEEEDGLFWKELSDFEEEKKMPYVTSVERIGYKRGMEEGFKKGFKKGFELGFELGLKKGQVSILSIAIETKFGANQDKIQSSIQHLNSEELTELGKMLFDFDTSTALFDWVRHRTRRQKASTP